MRPLFLALQIMKLMPMLLFGFIRLNYGFQKGRRAFKRSLLRGGVPAPLVSELVTEYGTIKRQLMKIPR